MQPSSLILPYVTALFKILRFWRKPYIGLVKNETSDVWQWRNGEEAEWVPWYLNQPMTTDNTGVLANSNPVIHSVLAETQAPYICQVNPASK